MTRINLVPPAELCRQHLVAEYRELPRVFGLVRLAIERGDSGPFPPAYTLGIGHVRFFYPRLAFLRDRQLALIQEMQARGYQPQFTAAAVIDDIPAVWLGTYVPTPEALALNRDRIRLRMPPK